MKLINVFRCERCGVARDTRFEMWQHEDHCLQLKVGQRVEFKFGIYLYAKGRITAIRKSEKLSEKPTVEILPEIDVTDAGQLDGLGGYIGEQGYVWVEWGQVDQVLFLPEISQAHVA